LTNDRRTDGSELIHRDGQLRGSPNRLLGAADGIDYAYREAGEGTPPLVLLQHFRGNLDNWDPALIDALASARRVVTFDNAGVGGSTGTTPTTVTQMARGAIAFLDAMEFDEGRRARVLDRQLRRSGGSIHQAVVRRLVLASSAPRGAAGMHGWAPEVIGAVGAAAPNPDGYRITGCYSGSVRSTCPCSSRTVTAIR